jgi:hypothetical protein
MLLGGGDELNGGELEAGGALVGVWTVGGAGAGVPPLLEAADDLADEAALLLLTLICWRWHLRLLHLTWTPSGLTAMKLLNGSVCNH